uniref:Tumor necrosis factor receptor superfamily, member 1b n=1 Tax=Jaculus jaculus TaxID=51337 RepID=A0A8C5K6G2_JACJA
MAPAAVWTALAVGLQLWATGHAVPAQVTWTPYAIEPGGVCRPREYHHSAVQMCCAMCPPGQHVKRFCTKTSDTVCTDCEDGTYTQLWNSLFTCLGCGSRCGPDQVKIQGCTRQQNRVCVCKPGMYCALATSASDSCRQCMRLRKCGPGFGATETRAANGNVVCRPCAPGTFSNTTSSTDACRPHRSCSIVAIPGNASVDAVCASESLTLRATQATADGSQPQPVSERSQPLEVTSGNSAAPNISILPEDPVPRGSIAGVIAGVTTLSLLLIGVVNCIILAHKREKPFCLQREAKVPHLPAEKSGDAPGLEQQHLLTTAPSSSSSSLESSASATGRRAPPRSQPQTPTAEEEEARGSWAGGSRSSDSSPGHQGPYVNVTCIVSVCSSSDHSSQCASQASATVGNAHTNPSGCPSDEQVPFSQEECPSQSHLEIPETLLQSHEEKALPLGVPDAGMKPSEVG